MFALQIHNTVGIDAIRAQALNTNAMLVKLISIVQHKSKDEQEWERLLEDMGGRKKVIESEDLVITMAEKIEGRSRTAIKDGKDAKTGTQSDAALDARSKTEPKSKTDEKTPVLSTKERFEIRQPLSSIIQANLQFYEGKLHAQVRIITDQIQKSTQQILRRLDSGSWEKVKHPEIRDIWKENVRAFSVGIVCRLSLQTHHNFSNGDPVSRLVSLPWHCMTTTSIDTPWQ